VLARRFRSAGLWAGSVACGLATRPVVPLCHHRVTRRRCPFHDDTASDLTRQAPCRAGSPGKCASSGPCR
jgi:hypothetical protein